MELVSLQVENFKNLRRMEVSFRPGLNVLHAPNETGKSSLADAIRGALLLPATSQASQDWVPWTSGGTPEVVLVFRWEGRYYRVWKSFAPQRGKAELQESNDNLSYRTIERDRAVDGKLREMLRWGIPEPGGRGGVKGLPATFLTKVLLAPQEDPMAVFDASLEDPNADESARRLLTDVLQAMAADPLLKKILGRAEQEVGLAFTPTGKFKKGKGSPLERLREELTELEESVKQTERELAEERRMRGEIERLRAELEGVRATREEREVARAKLAAALVQRKAVAAERDAAGRLLDEALALQQTLDDLAARTAACETERDRAVTAVEAAETEARAAAESLRGAETTLTRLQSAESEAQTELDKSRLQSELHRLAAGLKEAQARIEACDRIAGLVAEERRIEEALAGGERERAEAQRAREDCAARLEAAQGRRRRLDDLGRWLLVRDLAQQVEASQNAERRAAAFRAEAAARRGEAEALERALTALDLPAAAALREAGRLDRERETLRAALAVGLSVEIDPLDFFTARIRTDDAEAAEIPFTIERRVLAAKREIEVEIPDIARIRLRGGDEETRARAEAVEAQWTRTVKPLLKRAKAATVADLQTLVTGADEKRRKAADLRQQGEVCEERARDADVDPAAVQALQGRLAGAATGLDGRDETALASEAAGIDEARLAADTRSVEADIASLQEERSRHEGAIIRIDAAAEAQREQRRKVRETIERSTAGLAEPWERVREAAAAAVADLSRRQEQAQADLASLEQRSSRAIAETEAAARSARETATRADGRHREAQADAQRLREQFAALAAQRGDAQARLQAADRPARERAKAEADRRLADLLAAHADLTEDHLKRLDGEIDDLCARERDLERRIHEHEGGLEHTGRGESALRLERYRDALERKREEQRRTELDLQAWRLLRDTLTEVEREQSQHLGRALVEPIQQRFSDLRRRPAGLELSPSLKTTAVQIDGARVEIRNLSRGAQEQLSLILRLLIAERIRSTVLLDDQLVHTDPARSEWFRDWLRELATLTQIVVFTCRPEAYPLDGETHVVDLLKDG